LRVEAKKAASLRESGDLSGCVLPGRTSRPTLGLMPRFAAAAALVLAAAACAAAAARPSDQSQSEVRLPRTFPQELTLAADGSLWMTDQYGGVTRRAASA